MSQRRALLTTNIQYHFQSDATPASILFAYGVWIDIELAMDWFRIFRLVWDWQSVEDRMTLSTLVPWLLGQYSSAD